LEPRGAPTLGISQRRRETLKVFDAIGTPSEFEKYVYDSTQGCNNPGLQVANAFGVSF
jgi:hypothetical protein